MVKFRTTEPYKTINLAGGQAFVMTPELELVSLLLTSFIQDTYYEKASDRLNRLSQLITKIPDKKFIAKAAIYARNEFGMRSITHALVAELALITKSEPWLKYAIAQTIRRPDDILETVAYYLSKTKARGYKKGLSAALRKGIALSLNKFDEYQLAKYRGDRTSVKLVDIINLVHPKPTDKQKDTFKKLITGTLKSTRTWEAKLTKAGQESEDEEELLKNKSKAWAELLSSKRLGYFALLRNLRNIIEQSPESVEMALSMLTDKEHIKKSLVLPFRYLSAANEIQKLAGENVQRALHAINQAVELATENVPCFSGKTLIAVDRSGSMSLYFDKACLFAACFFKRNNADLLFFNDTSQYFNVLRSDSMLSITNYLLKRGVSGGTDFNTIFSVKAYYNRIIILSDMQAWVGHVTPDTALKAYKDRSGSDPFIYSIDLAGYGTLQFPQEKIACIAGFSEKIFDVIKLVETDKNALLKKIDTIEIVSK